MQDVAIPMGGPDVGEGFSRLGAALLLVTKASAIVGAAAFLCLVVMSLASIVGRKLLSMPVPGDVEILQMVAAGAAASFFGYCHLQGGDVKVDFFTQKTAPRTVLLMDAIGSLLVGLFGALLAWRTAAGALSLREVGETSPILAWPVWVAQAAVVPGLVLLALSGFYMAADSWRRRALAGGAA